MANTQAITDSFKQELPKAIHAFDTTVTRGATTADGFKASLRLASDTVNASTTVYSSTGEVTGTNYSAGGVAFTWVSPAVASNTMYTTPSANITYTNVTLGTAFDAVLLYNTSQSNKSVAVYTFGSQTVTAADFVLVVPTNNQTTGLLRLG